MKFISGFVFGLVMCLVAFIAINPHSPALPSDPFISQEELESIRSAAVELRAIAKIGEGSLRLFRYDKLNITFGNKVKPVQTEGNWEYSVATSPLDDSQVWTLVLESDTKTPKSGLYITEKPYIQNHQTTPYVETSGRISIKVNGGTVILKLWLDIGVPNARWNNGSPEFPMSIRIGDSPAFTTTAILSEGHVKIDTDAWDRFMAGLSDGEVIKFFIEEARSETILSSMPPVIRDAIIVFSPDGYRDIMSKTSLKEK